jgi:hypothetical protein
VSRSLRGRRGCGDYLVVGEGDYPKAHLIKEAFAFRVLFSLLLVDQAVDFNDQAR